MFQEIEIKNFHCHKDTKITLSQDFNIITGASDAGKSSLLRLIRWITDNRPIGNSIVNWDHPNEPVIGIIRTNHGLIEKIRKGGTSTYNITTSQGVLPPIDAFKTDIPEAVQDFFGFSEFNYQAQHSPYFLIDESPGARAVKLNDLVGLSIIDTMYKNLNSKAKKEKQLSSEHGNNAKELSDKIDGFSFIENAEKDLKEIESLVVRQEKISNNISKLESFIIDCERLEKEIGSGKKKLVIGKLIPEIKGSINDYKIKKNNINKLSNLIVSIQESEEFIAKYKPLISVESEISYIKKQLDIYSESMNRYNKLSGLIQNGKKLFSEINAEKEWLQIETPFRELSVQLNDYFMKNEQSTKLNNSIKKCEQLDIIEDKNRLEQLIQRKKDLLKQLGICPFCRSPLDVSVLNNL